MLPEARECHLRRLTSAEGNVKWTYSCKFGRDDETYERLVKAVESALGVALRREDIVHYSQEDWGLSIARNRMTVPPGLLELQIFGPNPVERTTVSPAAPPPPPQTEAELIRKAIQVVKEGEHGDLPIMIDPNTRMRAGPASLRVRNDTPYTLTVLMSGPADRRLEIAARSGTAIEVPSGTYKVAGKVDAPNVLASYGEHALFGAASMQFYIQ